MGFVWVARANSVGGEKHSQQTAWSNFGVGGILCPRLRLRLGFRFGLGFRAGGRGGFGRSDIFISRATTVSVASPREPKEAQSTSIAPSAPISHMV